MEEEGIKIQIKDGAVSGGVQGDGANQSNNDDNNNNDGGGENNNTPTPEVVLDDNSILKFFEDRGRKAASIDELLTIPEPTIIEKEVELPDNIKAYQQFYQETGGSFEDYVSLNRDYSSMDGNSVLAKYIALKNPTLSPQDVLDYMAQEYGINEEEMEEGEINRRNLNKKMALGKAIEDLNSQKERYKTDLASRKAEAPSKEEFEAFRSYQEQQQSRSEVLEQLQSKFSNQRNELFGENFNGFSFNVGADEPLVYKPENHRSLASDEMQSAKFVTSTYFDESGAIEDVEGFHKLIYMARNQDKILKAAYDKGAADAVLRIEKESKNLDMNGAPPAVSGSGGLKVKVDSGSGSTFVIRK